MAHPPSTIVWYTNYPLRVNRWGSRPLGVGAHWCVGWEVCGAPPDGGPGSMRRGLLAYGMAHDTDAGECQRRGVNGVCLGLARTLVVGPPWRMVWRLEVGHLRHQIRGQNGVRIICGGLGCVWSGEWMAAPSLPYSAHLSLLPRALHSLHFPSLPLPSPFPSLPYSSNTRQEDVRLPLPPTKPARLPHHLSIIIPCSHKGHAFLPWGPEAYPFLLIILIPIMGPWAKKKGTGPTRPVPFRINKPPYMYSNTITPVSLFHDT